MFFATGTDSTPAGATDDEYGLDALLDLARAGDNVELHALANATERMADAHMLRLDDLAGVGVTMAELDAALSE